MSASDNKMIAAIAKMYPSLKKSQIVAFMNKNKKSSITKIVAGKIPVVKKKRAK